MECTKQGQYQIVQVDGTVIIISEKPAFPAIHKWLKCDGTDSIDLKDGQVMIVDEYGKLNELPVTKKATALVSQHFSGEHLIYGDMAIVNDRDFG